MTRYVWDREHRCFVDPQTGLPMEIPEANRGKVSMPRILSDIPPYMSPMGSGLIEGRHARREDMKRHNVREVDPSEFKPSEAYQIKRERKRSSKRN